jgi:succinate dehydrogenase / fumarate reductase cytochrome b subunit
MLRYRGREGYWAWLLHRLSGVGVLAFLFLHVLDTSLVTFRPDAYRVLLDVYRAPLFRVLEVGLAAALLYHGINGLRIVLADFVDAAARRQRALWYLGWALFLALFVPTAFVMLRPLALPAVAGMAP